MYPFTMLERLGETEQSPEYHPEGNVWIHTLMVTDEAAKIKRKSKNPLALMLAALLHDLGKPDTFKNINGKITAYNHDVAGARLSAEFLNALTDDGALIRSVSGLVRWHMQILYVTRFNRFSELSKMRHETDVREVALLALCDRLGRGNTDREEEIRNIGDFLNRCGIPDG